MIRTARIADKPHVVRLMEESRVGAGFDRADSATGFQFPFEPAYAERLFAVHVRGVHMLCLVSVNADDVPHGVLMATASEHPFGPVWLARETLWWINPAHRGGSTALRMLAAYEQWATFKNCRFIGMAGMGDDPQVGLLYERRGYRKAETHYLKSAA